MLDYMSATLIDMLHKLSTTGVIKWYTVNYDTSQLITKITFRNNNIGELTYNIQLTRNYIESNEQTEYTIKINELEAIHLYEWEDENRHKLLDEIFRLDTKDVVEELVKDIRKEIHNIWWRT